jgi:hypothetical protein
VLTKEKKGVESELKSDAKSAAAKKADDRKDAGPLPAEYPEPKRDEPSELDGSNAAKGRPESWTEGPGSKEAAAKTACDDKCGADCEHKKEASAKTAEEGDASPVEDKPAEESKAEEKPAEESMDAPADEAPAEEAPAEEPKEEETFDPEVTNLEEAASDLEADVARIQDAIAELSGEEPGDISFAEGDMGEGDEEDPFGVGGDDLSVSEEPLPNGGEELNLEDIFDQGNMSDKVSALNDEDHGAIELALDMEGDDFFAPSDPSSLESVLDQEEDLSTPEMFAVNEVENDPLARIFASMKQAGEEEGIVHPGDIDSHFETDLKGDDRDNESDHEGSIFEEVLNSLKQPTRDDHRQGETEPHLKEPTGKEAGKKQAAGIRTIRQVPSKKEAGKANLAALLFTDEADYL